MLQQHRPICPCLQAVLSIFSSLIINDHTGEGRNVPPTPTLTSLQVSGVYSQEGCLSFYIPLFVVCDSHPVLSNPITHYTNLVENMKQCNSNYDPKGNCTGSSLALAAEPCSCKRSFLSLVCFPVRDPLLPTDYNHVVFFFVFPQFIPKRHLCFLASALQQRARI